MKYLLTIVAMSLTLSLNAWERTAKRDCEDMKDQCQKNAEQTCNSQDKESCKQMKEDCKMQYDQCKRDIEKTDEKSFSSALSFMVSRKFNDFTHKEKVKAMDYADKNKMDPDAAVEKVMSDRK